jgi:hypothetical protein
VPERTGELGAGQSLRGIDLGLLVVIAKHAAEQTCRLVVPD